jgi:hypothetical protein
MCTGLYFAQNQLIFDPNTLSNDFTFRVGVEKEVLTPDGISINCIQLQAEKSKGVILYLHGNRGSNRRCLRQAKMFEGFGYDILMPDYRGYGKTEGSITSEKQLYQDVQLVYDALKKDYNESQIIVVGYSLGTGMASYLASRNDPRHLVLIAAYESFTNLKDRRFPIIPDFILKYPLNNAKHLEKVKCPVTLLHGTEDSIIPYDSSLELQKIRPNEIELVTLSGTGHRGSIFSSKVRDVMLKITR